MRSRESLMLALGRDVTEFSSGVEVDLEDLVPELEFCFEGFLFDAALWGEDHGGSGVWVVLGP